MMDKTDVLKQRKIIDIFKPKTKEDVKISETLVDQSSSELDSESITEQVIISKTGNKL